MHVSFFHFNIWEFILVLFHLKNLSLFSLTMSTNMSVGIVSQRNPLIFSDKHFLFNFQPVRDDLDNRKGGGVTLLSAVKFYPRYYEFSRRPLLQWTMKLRWGGFHIIKVEAEWANFLPIRLFILKCKLFFRDWKSSNNPRKEFNWFQDVERYDLSLFFIWFYFRSAEKTIWMNDSKINSAGAVHLIHENSLKS